MHRRTHQPGGARASIVGFTLIELLIVVAVVALLGTLTAPSFTRFIKDMRLRAASTEVIVTVQNMRVEAMRRAQPITVCASVDGATCNGSGLQDGWIEFVDSNGDGDLDAGTDVLLRVSPPLTQATIAITGLNGSNAYFTLGATGRLTAAGSLKICDDRTGSYGKTISVNVAGRTYLTSGSTC